MNKLMTTSSILSLFLALSPAWACDTCGCSSKTACASTQEAKCASTQEAKLVDIVHTAQHSGNFSTLIAALEAADLVEALKSPGPFTVFAPTDKAFAALPAGTVESLLKPENKAKLQAILKYHVVPGKVMSGQILKSWKTKTLHGNNVKLNLMVNNANVTKADVKASNGVIHVIDRVILPGAAKPIKGHKNAKAPLYTNKDIVQTAVNAGQFKTLVTAIQAAGLENALAGKGPFTVFAPTDKAFAKLPAGTVESLVQPENKAKLQAILKYHVIPAKLRSHDVLATHTVKTLNGESIYPSIRVDNAAILTKNIYCRNGIIHVIDNVILPKEKS
jgi:uncharacterized surface protein with fasciclin (FAS1) repeats